jgi:MFS family permease
MSSTTEDTTTVAWRDPAVLAVAGVVAAAGFGQFGAVAALGDVAEHFGQVGDGDEVAQQIGLTATTVGLGLALIRLASLGSLPLAGLADRFGRRTVLLACCAAGLILTVAAAGSPSFWWFVAIFAISRPFLTAADAIGVVAVAEHTGSADRSKAIAVVAAAYGLGAGLVAVVRGVAGDTLTFRGLFLLAVVPLLVVPFAGRWIREPHCYRSVSDSPDRPVPVLGALARQYRPRLAVVVTATFAISLAVGPANSYLFVYGENVLDLSPAATSAMVVAAGPVGLVGLLIGRWAADTLGRRGAAALTLAGVAAAFAVTYSGTTAALVSGYLGAILMGSAFSPAIGALATELFPTSVRATVAGWVTTGGVLGAVTGLVAFGALSDRFDEFGTAAVAIAIPAAISGTVVFLVRETKGQELDETEERGVG